MKTVAAVMVRMGSSRLPGKTMADVGGVPLLGMLLERLRQCRCLDGIVVATSLMPENDVIEDYCRETDTAVFRGSENDVLGRLLGAWQSQGAVTGVSVFGDGPLLDPAIVDHLVSLYRQAGGAYDFVGNDLKTTYPPGMEAEVVSVSAQADAATRTDDPAIREHGTFFIRSNPQLYRLLNVEAPPVLRRPELEIEVDTREDIEVIRTIVGHFGARRDFSLGEIIAFLDCHADVALSNAHVPRRWKTLRDEEH